MAGVVTGQFESEEDIIRYFSTLLKQLYEQDAMDLAPHQVMSHAFMEWFMLIRLVAPSVLLKPTRHHYDLFCRRFFQFKHYKGYFMDKDEITILKLQGWKAFLKD